MPRDTMPQPLQDRAQQMLEFEPAEEWFNIGWDAAKRYFVPYVAVGSTTLGVLVGAGGMYLWLT